MAAFQEPEEELVEDILKELEPKKIQNGPLPGVDDILAELGIAAPYKEAGGIRPAAQPMPPKEPRLPAKALEANAEKPPVPPQEPAQSEELPARMALRFAPPDFEQARPLKEENTSSLVQDYFQELSQRRDDSGHIKSEKQLKKEARRQEKAEKKRRKAEQADGEPEEYPPEGHFLSELDETQEVYTPQEEGFAQPPAPPVPDQKTADAEKSDTLERIQMPRITKPIPPSETFDQPDMDDTREFVVELEDGAFNSAGETGDAENSSAHLSGTFEEEQFKKFFTSRVGTMAQDKEPDKKPWFHLRRGRQHIEEDGEAYVDFDDQEWDEAPDKEAQDEDVVEDYNAPADAQPILQDLKGMKRGLLIRTVLTGILALLLLYLGLSANGAVPALPGLSAKQPFTFLLAEALLLAAASLISFRSIAGGITGFWGEATTDTLAALGILGAFLQLIAYFANNTAYNAASVTLFAPAAVLGLCVNALGKWMFSRTMVRNFELSTAQDEYAAAYLVDEGNLTHKVTQGLAEPEPRLLVSRPTALVKGFLKQSFSERASDRLAKKLSFAVLGVSIVCGGLSWIFSGDACTGLTALAAAACLGAPLAATLTAALPNTLMQQAAAQVGAVIPGWSAMEELSSANVVMAGVRDLFPAGRVRLGGIKTFSKERIDLAILYAASILVQGCSTLRDIFLQVIEGNTGMLYTVENLTRETGCGFEGWIEHNRVIVGNRRMMENHGIDIPSMDYEERYTGGGKKPVYLSVSGKLFGMFLVSYQADPDVAEVLEQLEAGGISLMVQSDDFSVTSELIETVYGLRPGGVKVLTAEDERALEPCLSYLPESDGSMTHIGTFASFVGGLRAATAGVSAEKLSGILMASASALGLILVVLLTITQGLSSLTLPAVILFQLAWLVLTIAGPLFKKYQ